MPLVESYVALRRAAGFKMDTIAWRLGRFAKFAGDHGDSHVRAETAVTWAGQGRSPHARHIRLRDVVRFAEHLRAEDPAHELPSRQVYPYHWIPKPPHIYTDEQVLAILDAAGRLGPLGSSRPATYRTLLALLAVTGMRVGEALRLRISDDDEDGLVVRETKFRKSRLLPLHASTRRALDGYRARWRPLAGPDEPLFVSLRRRELSRCTVDNVFLQLASDLGLRPPAGSRASPSRGPHIHDLRHTFAVRALEACPEGRVAINRHTLALTTYLGHSKVRDTFWYLHSTPQLMTDIADACAALDTGGGR